VGAWAAQFASDLFKFCLKMDARSQHVYSWPGCLLGVFRSLA